MHAWTGDRKVFCSIWCSIRRWFSGYQLWIGSSRGLLLMNLAHSANVSLERVVMIGADRIYLSPLRSHEKHATAPHMVWETLKIPYDYIGANWPIRVRYPLTGNSKPTRKFSWSVSTASARRH